MKQLVIMGVCAVLAGCISNPPLPDTYKYLLRADAALPDGRLDMPVRIGIGRVALAGYIDRGALVLVDSNNQVTIAQQNLWAEPLDSAIRVFLRDAISSDLDYAISGDSARRLTWDYRIDLQIDEFHGTFDGNAKLVANWGIVDTITGKLIAAYRFDETARLQADGYQALVDTQAELLQFLSVAIAESIETLPALIIEADAESG